MFTRNFKISVLAMLLLLSFSLGGIFDRQFFLKPTTADNLMLDEQEATIRAIKKVKPAVVSIIVYGTDVTTVVDVNTGKSSTVKERVKKGSGTGILISADGLLFTNKHVVNSVTDDSAAYRVILNSGKEYYALLIGKDPMNDLAVLKIFDKNLPYIEMGDSDKLEPGISVIAIGNSLGLFQNSVTKGIISGIGRSVVAGDQTGNIEALDNVIQTDAGINLGNSGGPLIDLNGKVIGINVAVAPSSQSIGFAIPINDAKGAINSVKEKGLIIRPWLGVNYIMLTPEIAKDSNLPVNYGAWINNGTGQAVSPDSPAQKGGMENDDIILEINKIKLDGNNTLRSVIQKFKPGNKIGLRIQRGDTILVKTVVLEQFK